MASHELTLKDYQQQLSTHIKLIYENYTELLRTKTEHLNYEVQVRSAEIVRSYQCLMQLLAEIRSFLIINDLTDLNESPSSSSGHPTPQKGAGAGASGVTPTRSASAPGTPSAPSTSDEKLIRLRDEMSMLLYELEIPLP